MQIHRFIVDINLKNKILRIKDGKLAQQLRKVLRLRIGDRIILSSGKGEAGEFSIIKLTKEFIDVSRIRELPKSKENGSTNVTLFCAILKKDNFELVVQKSTEVGINGIVPLLSRRTVKQSIKIERVLKIIKEASEQSGKVLLPKLAVPMEFEDALTYSATNECNIIFDASGCNFSDILSEIRKYKSIGLFIGPEGGWDKTELDLAEHQKFKVISLSAYTLRAETAAIIASYLICNKGKLWI